MKKIIAGVLLVSLVGCMAALKDPASEATEPAPQSPKKAAYLVDMCSPENLPRFPKRPTLTKKELQGLSEDQMDERIKRHISNLEKYIDTLVNVIVDTRNRVERCR
jgi:hypothetical protein